MHVVVSWCRCCELAELAVHVVVTWCRCWVLAVRVVETGCREPCWRWCCELAARVVDRVPVLGAGCRVPVMVLVVAARVVETRFRCRFWVLAVRAWRIAETWRWRR